MLIENEMPSSMVASTPLNRSKSAATLKVDTSLTNEDSIGAFVQLMSIAVAMLESHIDNEYLLALNLMDKVSKKRHCATINLIYYFLAS